MERKYTSEDETNIYLTINREVDCSINIDLNWDNDLVILFDSKKGYYPVINLFVAGLCPDLKAYQYNELISVIDYGYHDFNRDYYNPKEKKCYKLLVNNFIEKLHKLTGIDYTEQFIEKFIKDLM